MSSAETARGYLRLTRPGNAIAAAFLTFVGAFVAAGLQANPPTVAFGVIATACATGAGNAINDYFDRDIDAINRPDRPIPSGVVSARGAAIFSIALFIGATVAALQLPLLAIAIAIVNLGALVAYTEFFKGLPGVGNALVGYLTGSTFLFGGAAVGDVAGAVVLFGLATVATFAREVVKDVEDLDGDRAEGLRTLPIVLGEQTSLRLGAGPLLVGVAASVIPAIDGTFGWMYAVGIVPANGLMLWAMWRSFEDPSIGQRYLKWGMFVAAGAFFLGRIAVII